MSHWKGDIVRCLVVLVVFRLSRSDECQIKGTVFECENHIIPTSLPAHAETVTLKHVNNDGILNYSDSSWRRVKRLSLNFGKQYDQPYSIIMNLEIFKTLNAFRYQQREYYV